MDYITRETIAEAVRDFVGSCEIGVETNDDGTWTAANGLLSGRWTLTESGYEIEGPTTRRALTSSAAGTPASPAPVPALMTYTPTDWEVRVPPGTYFLGDPCYAVPEAEWKPLTEDAGMFDAKPVGVVRGVQVLAFNAFGPDIGVDQYDGEYLVDSGLIGLVPEVLFTGNDAKYDRSWLNKFGRVVTFGADTTCRSGETLVFGQYQICADPYLEEGNDDGH